MEEEEEEEEEEEDVEGKKKGGRRQDVARPHMLEQDTPRRIFPAPGPNIFKSQFVKSVCFYVYKGHCWILGFF